MCTGNVSAYEVTVPARGGTFTAGTAAVCATAENRGRDGVVVTRQWCRAAGVALAVD